MGLKPDPIEPLKFYRVEYDAWVPVHPGEGCTGHYAGESYCCLRGDELETGLEDYQSCTEGGWICGFNAHVETILQIRGPYDTFFLCDAD